MVGTDFQGHAARSSNTSTPAAGAMEAAGIVAPWRQFARAVCFPVPVTRNNTRRASLRRRTDRLTRSGGGLGAENTGSAAGAFGPVPRSWPGNRLAV